MENDIIEAIDMMKVLIVRYSAGERVIEPHAFGLGTSGNLLLRAYQREGASESGAKEGWKLFKTDEFYSLEITDEDFTVRAGYKSGDKALSVIRKEI